MFPGRVSPMSILRLLVVLVCRRSAVSVVLCLFVLSCLLCPAVTVVCVFVFCRPLCFLPEYFLPVCPYCYEPSAVGGVQDRSYARSLFFRNQVTRLFFSTPRKISSVFLLSRLYRTAAFSFCLGNREMDAAVRETNRNLRGRACGCVTLLSET